MNIADYTKPNGLGKFEGEPPWARYFYDRMMDGSDIDVYDIDDVLWCLMEVDDDEKAAGVLLKSTQTVALREDSNGFVYVSEFNASPALVEGWLTDPRVEIDWPEYLREVAS